MTIDPITIPVSSSIDGLELVETLARRGLAAALVSRQAGWQVELAVSDHHRAVLLDEVTTALEGSLRPFRGSFPRNAVRHARPSIRSSDWSGFRVESEQGRIGVVAVVRRDARSGGPRQLVVRAGRAGRRALLVAVEDVDVVMPAARRLLLRRGWAPLPAETVPVPLAS